MGWSGANATPHTLPHHQAVFEVSLDRQKFSQQGLFDVSMPSSLAAPLSFPPNP